MFFSAYFHCDYATDPAWCHAVFQLPAEAVFSREEMNRGMEGVLKTADMDIPEYPRMIYK